MVRSTVVVGEIRQWKWLLPNDYSNNLKRIVGKIYNNVLLEDGANICISVKSISEYLLPGKEGYLLIKTPYSEPDQAFKAFLHEEQHD